MLSRLSFAALTLAVLLPSCNNSGETNVSTPATVDEQPATETASADAGSDVTADDAAIAALDAFLAEKNYDTTLPGWRGRMFRPPWQTFDAANDYYWNLLTNKGLIKIRLMTDVAPKHATSTIYLTRAGFYDGVIFHRVITDFMAQGGDPTGTGRGGPGYKYDGEFSPDVRHDRPGLLSMANSGPGTDGSQFFLTFVPYPSLNGKHTIFGEVVEGMDVVTKLEEAGSRQGTPSEALVIERATISVEASSGAD